MMRSRRARAIALSVIATIFLAMSCAAATPSAGEHQILFILDASGSMWGRVEGKTKIEIARNVLQEILATLPPDQSAGFMAYGHRRKGDCSDIETLVPIAKGRNAELAAAVKNVQPKGMTPISDALVQAANSLKYKEKAASIVFVSDGKETCQGDPCAVAKSLHQAGVDLKMYVVGFDVNSSEAAQLQCIADNSGGHYFTAKTTQDLTRALTAIKAHVVTQEPLPAQTQAQTPAQAAPQAPKVETGTAATTRVKLGAVATIRLQPASWVRMPPRYWKVMDAESGKEVGLGDGDTIRIAPGIYQLRWHQAEHETMETPLNTTVVAESGQTATVLLDTGIRLTGPEGLGDAYAWKLVDDMGQVVARFGGKETYLPQLVPAGRYSLIWRLREHDTGEADLGDVDIATGQLLDKVLDTGAVLALPDWLGKPYEAILEEKGGGRYSFKLPGVHPLKPGEYVLTWRQSEHGHTPVSLGTISISPGQYAPLPVNSGLTFLAKGQKPPYRILATNKATGEKAELKGNWGPMPLRPGSYALEMQEKEHGSTPIRLADELSIQPGQLLELEL